jgi:glutathione S-transferase
MLKLNPAGSTPFLVLEDNTVISESVTMVKFLDSYYEDTHPTFHCGKPNDAVDQACRRSDA